MAGRTNSNVRNGSKEIEQLEETLKGNIDELSKARGTPCFPLMISESSIGNQLVDDVFSDLMTNYHRGENLDVVVDSGGGSIDAAYNLAQLFRRYASAKLTFVIPRWAKSAATLLVCGGDQILMTPVAELGPLDPQITAPNPVEDKLERFSPLHIESTLELIRTEYKNGNVELAQGLMQRLHFPLTLGVYKKMMDIGKDYTCKLLASRMLKDDKKKPLAIGERLASGYVDHSYCINADEAAEMGLKVAVADGAELNAIWAVYEAGKRLSEARRTAHLQRIIETLERLPPELRDKIPIGDLMKGKAEAGANGGRNPSGEKIDVGAEI